MGTLYIVATPIGNLEDITIRAIKTLFSVNYIACEDTRRTGLLLQQLRKNYGSMVQTIKLSSPRLISYYDEVEEQKAPEVLDLLEREYNVALVSDAGTPLISDPGYKLVKAAIKYGVKIVSIPGPSSVIAALVASGLPSNDFRFIGYLPPKRSKRITKLKSIISSTRPHDRYHTIILFESPQRLKEMLEDLQTVYGDIPVVIARELTKIHEKYMRSTVSEILTQKLQLKGEIVVLFSIE